MARTPVADRPPIARWLIESRKSLRHPETGKPWTVDYALAQMRAAGHPTPNPSNYAQWESGAVPSPKEELLQPFIDFYKARGLRAPERPSAPEPVPELASVLRDLASELSSAREERALLRVELDALKAEREAWARGVVAALRDLGGRAPATLLASLVPQRS